MKFYEILIPV